MNRIRIPLTLALLFVTLGLLAYFGTLLLVGPIFFLYRNAPGLSAARTVAQIAALFAVAGLFVSMAIVAIPAAFQPANWSRKWLYILPGYLLAFTLAGVLSYFLDIGTLGSLFGTQTFLRISFTTAWLAIGAALGMIAIVIAVARMDLSEKIQKLAMRAIGVTFVPSLLLVLTILISIGIVTTNQPGISGLGPPDAAQVPGGQDASGIPAGVAGFVTQFEIGSGVMTLFALIAGLSVVRGVRALRGVNSVTSAPVEPIDYRREINRAIVTTAAMSAVILLVIQLIPVSRTNPPVQADVQWDSPQTKDLVNRACMNCHSNETQWRWYSYVAPSSWLNVIHVNSARQRYNLSEVANLNAARRTRLARDMVDAIRNDRMPPKDYRLLHTEAQLTDAEKQQLIQGLQNSIK